MSRETPEPTGAAAATDSKAIATAKRAEWVVLGTTACICLGAGIQIPFMQGRRDALGCDALCYGSMTSVRSALSLGGGVVMGRLSDQLGRFPAIMAGCLAYLASTLIFLSWDSLSGLWAALVLPAIFGDSMFLVMKAVLADHARASNQSDADRAASLGRLGFAAGVGFALGPTAGAYVFKDYKSAAWACLFFQVHSYLTTRHPVPHSP